MKKDFITATPDSGGSGSTTVTMEVIPLFLLPHTQMFGEELGQLKRQGIL